MLVFELGTEREVCDEADLQGEGGRLSSASGGTSDKRTPFMF